MAELRDAFDAVYKDTSWGVNDDTRSGHGSTRDATRELRTWLERFIGAFDIRLLLDAPCGEWGWMQYVRLGQCAYVGVDVTEAAIVSNRKRFPDRRFETIDFTKAELPMADAVLVKDCFQHLTNDDIKKGIDRIRATGARYLVTSSDVFPSPRTNDGRPARSGATFSPEALAEPPFNFPEPVGTIRLDRKVYSVNPLNHLATDEERARLLSTIMQPMDDAELDLRPILDAVVCPTFTRFGERDGVPIILPKRAYLQLGVRFDLPAAAARFLCSFEPRMTVADVVELADEQRLGVNRQQVVEFLWVCSRLYLVDVGFEGRDDFWELRGVAAALFGRSGPDSLHTRELCEKILRPASWFAETRSVSHPAETLFQLWHSAWGNRLACGVGEAKVPNEERTQPIAYIACPPGMLRSTLAMSP